jgi:hypothetical protein
MTTGLQRVPTTARPAPIASLLRFVAKPFRAPTRPGRWHHRTTAVSATRPAHDIRRRARASLPARARDVHDAAVMRGVFPPRV